MAFCLGFLDDFHIGGDQAFFHLVIAIKEQHPLASGVLKPTVARRSRRVVLLANDLDVEAITGMLLLECFKHLQGVVGAVVVN